jgi:hypothetical protein
MDHMVSKDEFYPALKTFGTKFDLWPPFGLPIIEDPVENLITYWCPVNPDPPTGVPTIFQLIAPTGPGWMQAAFEEQGKRPNKYHNTNFRVPDFNVLLENLQRRGVPHRVEDSFSIFNGRRLFIGRTRENPLAYDGSYDFNMRLEAVEAGFRIQGYGSRNPKDRWRSDRQPSPGGYVKVVSRSVVVKDVESAIDTLGRNFFLWPRPDSTIENDRSENVRRAMIASEPTGLDAFIELVQPLDESSRAGLWMKQWGVGPWALTIQVNDLGARLKLFDERGVHYEIQEPTAHTLYTRAHINPDDAHGAVLIFTDMTS